MEDSKLITHYDGRDLYAVNFKVNKSKEIIITPKKVGKIHNCQYPYFQFIV